MDSKEKLAGWALVIYAVLSLAAASIACIVFYLFFFTELPELLVWIFIAFLAVLILINSVGLAAGIGLIQEDSGAHTLAVPYSIFCLLNFPIGTVVGFFYLWVYYERRA
ncbi:hypothetical protein [Microbulbifer taiwanensis]|uniref:Uncharacterized protein n=1 Tax=Microbulbifer taiwanensis TaxID=986746 RepID=A0ABW1YUE6_9GAMM|nr:hypothetical protein [Microbulbifer taiwanensis]